jgi:hypothetical protein
MLKHLCIPKKDIKKGGTTSNLEFVKKKHKYLTLNDMQKAMGAHSFFSAESIFGTCTSRMSKGPDAD